MIVIADIALNAGDMILASREVVHVLADMPGQNLSPQAPGEIGGKVDRGLSIAQYIAFAIAILGVIAMGAMVIISRSRGGMEEATEIALKIIGGVTLISGAVGIVSAFM